VGIQGRLTGKVNWVGGSVSMLESCSAGSGFICTSCGVGESAREEPMRYGDRNVT